MTHKSYKQGDPFPPLEMGKLRLYSMRFCPYSQRVRLVLAHKKIPYETININLKTKPDWFIVRSPKGLVPLFEKDSEIIYESQIICDYLDAKYPHNRLTPTDPYQRAMDALLLDFFSIKFVPIFFQLIYAEEIDQETSVNFLKTLQKLEKELAVRGVYFGGCKIAMIDFLFWPFFERLPALFDRFPIFTLSAKLFPKLFGWTQSMLVLPAVKETFIDPETHLTFYQLSEVGSAGCYDIDLS